MVADLVKANEPCVFCNKGHISETVEKDYVAEVCGTSFTIPEAVVGRCDKCGGVNYAIRKDVLMRAREGGIKSCTATRKQSARHAENNTAGGV